jgi:hypothetical protein
MSTKSMPTISFTKQGWISVEMRALTSIKKADDNKILEISSCDSFYTDAILWQDVKNTLSRMEFQREWKKHKKVENKDDGFEKIFMTK